MMVSFPSFKTKIDFLGKQLYSFLALVLGGVADDT